ncbi:MAG: adenosine deaminase [Saprospiraceae bacterium]|nr:adenosine deaminase [Saprospiraceae bacterium]
MNYSTYPKVELHLHLDCSLSYDVVNKINPEISKAEYLETFTCGGKCSDLPDYLKKALKGFELMQTKEELQWVTEDLFEQLKKDNVIYAEIRFAPLQHLKQGLSASDVVKIVNDTTESCVRKTGIEAGIILCTLRHFSEEESMTTVKLVEEYKNSKVVGFDIAGDEVGFPIDAHKKAFEYAKDHGIHCTAHAGEADGPKSVWESLNQFHPSRIGHGVRSAEDDDLLLFLKKENIHLEVCPTSNIQTHVYPNLESHSLPKIYGHGVSMSLSTDGRTVSDVSLTDEYNNVAKAFNWNLEQFKICNLEAIEHAFTTQEIKDKLRTKIFEAYQ